MLKGIKLENFRNHSSIEVEFDLITALIGPNGAGKSNILEAVSMISFCRSFREEDKKNLIQFDKPYARVSSGELEIFLQRSPYVFSTRKKGVGKRQADFVGTIKAVVFSPESLNFFSDGPKTRRRFLDIMISQKNRQYLRALINYEKVKTERNALLGRICEGQGRREELDFWDGELVKEGQIVIDHRRLAVDYLNQKVPDIYQEISGKGESLFIEYQTNTADFAASLKKNLEREIIIGRTQVGPHKDDLVVKLDNTSVENFASRGETRTSVLSLKVAELEYLTEGETENPVLLLDDVFSEFDEDRRLHLGKLLDRYQTILTTTDKDHLSKDLLKKAKIIEIGTSNK